MASVLPSSTTGGLLPYWTLMVSSLAILNTLRTHTDPQSVLLIFAGPHAPTENTSLAARNYGAWTFTAGLVRAFTAYRINDPAMYALCMLTYAVVIGAFMLETTVYGTMRWEKRMLSGMGVAGLSLGWMVVQWGWYIGATG